MTVSEVKRLKPWSRERVLIWRLRHLVEAEFLHICYPPEGEPRNAKVSLNGKEIYVPFTKIERRVRA